MFYNPLLNKVVSRLDSRAPLNCVHQCATGEFVASDGQIMLVEYNNLPQLATFYDPKTGEPTQATGDYPDFKDVLKRGKNGATHNIKHSSVRFTSALASVRFSDNLTFYFRKKHYEIVREFLGAECIIKAPNTLGAPLYFSNGESHALIMPFMRSTLKGAKWEVLDRKGEKIWEGLSLDDAEMFFGDDYTIKLGD